jgi:hypothetical protein
MKQVQLETAQWEYLVTVLEKEAEVSASYLRELRDNQAKQEAMIEELVASAVQLLGDTVDPEELRQEIREDLLSHAHTFFRKKDHMAIDLIGEIRWQLDNRQP